MACSDFILAEEQTRIRARYKGMTLIQLRDVDGRSGWHLWIYIWRKRCNDFLMTRHEVEEWESSQGWLLRFWVQTVKDAQERSVCCLSIWFVCFLFDTKKRFIQLLLTLLPWKLIQFSSISLSWITEEMPGPSTLWTYKLWNIIFPFQDMPLHFKFSILTMG